MPEKRKFPWMRALRLLLAACIGLALGVGYHEYRRVNHELAQYKIRAQELQKTIDGFCTNTEIRILSCPGRIDGCLCMPVNPRRSDFE